MCETRDMKKTSLNEDELFVSNTISFLKKKTRNRRASIHNNNNNNE